MFRAGDATVQAKLPSLIGYEAAGVVEVLGEGVEGYAIGERVCVMPVFRQGEYGVYGEKAIVPCLRSPVAVIMHRAATLLPAPLQAASSIWMQYFTAFGIIEVGRIGLGDYVLITAASSSVGLAAIQLCNWVGATPIAATRHGTKVAALLGLGVKHVVTTAEGDLVAEVMRITGGKGTRVVFDAVGGPQIERLMNAMAEEGLLLVYGGLSGQTTPYPWPTAFFRGVNMRGWVGTAIWNKPERLARTKDLILRGLADGHLRPVIAKTFPLAQIVEAHRYLESNEHVGKIVVTV